MRSLFAKIFLSFFLTVLVLAAFLQLSTMTRPNILRSPEVRGLIARKAASAADAYERGGTGALEQELQDFPLAAALLDAAGRVLAEAPSQGRSIAPAASRVVAEAEARGQSKDIVVGPDISLQPVRSASGVQYFLAMPTPHERPFAVLATLDQYPAVRVSILVVVAGIVCFILARHITSPLVRLRATAAEMANGHLEARAGRPLTKRHDEIGALGRDFDQMADRLSALVASERRLLADVSHELRSPLARLTVAVGLARQRAGGQATAELDRIDKEVRRLDTLIGQSLTLARIESGLSAGPIETFDLTSLVQEIAADGDFEARASGRRVEMPIAEVCAMTGVADLVRSGIENVVRNAIRYTSPGTSVTVELRREAGQARIRVADRGPGIPDALLQDMFLPFRRADPSGGPASGGAGLGLAIADRVVRMHGGAIAASNAPGGGLLVDITLPTSANHGAPGLQTRGDLGV